MFSKLLKTSPALLGALFLIAYSSAGAQAMPKEGETASSNSQLLEQLNRYEEELGQVTNVNQLRDVSPGHWAHDALKKLIERYGCIRGYEDGTYRGNNPVTRYEFAVTLSDCLQAIERLIAASNENSSRPSRRPAIDRGDLSRIQRLVSEFEAELAVLGSRVDDLEGRVDFLEDHQFSTTTKLKGEVLFTLAGATGGDPGATVNEQIILADRVRLNFDTSFTGKDRLRTRLQAGNFGRFGGTNVTRLGHDAGGGNNIVVNDLYYRFPVGDKTRIYVGTNSFTPNNVFPVLNPYLASSGTGALARFGRRNPLIHRAPGGAGAGVQHKFSNKFKLSALYLTNGDGSDPSDREGLFNGTYSAGVQLDFKPADKWDLSLTYLRTYETGDDVNISASTTSGLSRRPFGSVDTEANRFGVNTNVKVSDRFNIGGWFGLADAKDVKNDDSATVITWSVNLAFPDLGGEGNVGGLIFGMPPKVVDNDDASREDQGTSFHIEALYKYKVNKNIYITPGAYVILNPENNDNNDSIVVGAVRTTFKF